MKQILFYLTIIIIFFSCKEDTQDWREKLSETTNQKLEESKTYILSKQKMEYHVKNGSPTKEQALLKFLEFASQEEDYKKNPYLFTDEELEEVLYPNVLGYGTSLDKTPLEDYRKVISQLTDLGHKRIYQKLAKRNVKIDQVIWQNTRNYNKLKGHKPDSLSLRLGKDTVGFDQIKMVMEVNGSYKVAVISP